MDLGDPPPPPPPPLMTLTPEGGVVEGRRVLEGDEGSSDQEERGHEDEG